MRECLSNFTAVQFRMKRVLQEHHLLGGLEQDLANQSRLIYQMLRLTRQAELTQELNDKAFPREEGFDLAMVCQGMADEATWLAGPGPGCGLPIPATWSTCPSRAASPC